MAAMTSKFNFECVIQYDTDHWTKYRVHFKEDLIRTKLLGISKTTLIES